MKVRTIALVATMVALAAVGTASAKSYGTHYKHYNGTYDDERCLADYGFLIHIDGYDNVLIKDVYDRQGNLLRTEFNDKHVATATANGKTLKLTADSKITWDYVKNTETWDGVAERWTVPSGKILVQDTGKIVFDGTTGEILSEGGQHPIAHGSTAVCDYFAS